MKMKDQMSESLERTNEIEAKKIAKTGGKKEDKVKTKAIEEGKKKSRAL